KGGKGRFYPCELSEEKNIHELYKQVSAEYDLLDVLVNCAGVWKTCLLEQISQASFDEVFKINTGSVVFMTKYFMDMLEKGKGCIVNISSVGGLQSKISGRSQYLYGASKAAVIQFSQLCALNYAGRVRVNCICPGLTDTPIFTNRDFSRFQGQIPIGRMGMPKDQALAVLFLASEEASFITGAVLTVDGGASLV
ncbi:MAG: SDR family oxidoreductase, partial [Selenomonas sp.]|nr:SDR family oxidoreductase [Selenomonas sp.]